MKKLMLLFLVAILWGGFFPSNIFATDVTTTFTWTAPGDDDTVGTATTYDLRMAMDSLDLINDWTNCAQIMTNPPNIVNTPETLIIVLDLNSETTYYFAIKTADEVFNWSEISNITSRHIADIIPPAIIIDFTVE